MIELNTERKLDVKKLAKGDYLSLERKAPVHCHDWLRFVTTDYD